MIDAAERKIFESAKSLLNEIEALKADLAQWKDDAIEAGLTKERVGDLLAVAKLEVMDQAKRAKKDEQARRRAELEGQLSMLPEEPKKPRLTMSAKMRAAPKGSFKAQVGEALQKVADKFEDSIEALKSAPEHEPEPPHDPETGEVIEEAADLMPEPGSEAFDAYADLRAAANADEQAEGAHRGVPYQQGQNPAETPPVVSDLIRPEDDLAAARRASFDEDLEIPSFARRGHPDCPVGRVPEAAE